jgi:hypothetical protein
VQPLAAEKFWLSRLLSNLKMELAIGEKLSNFYFE